MKLQKVERKLSPYQLAKQEAAEAWRALLRGVGQQAEGLRLLLEDFGWTEEAYIKDYLRSVYNYN